MSRIITKECFIDRKSQFDKNFNFANLMCVTNFIAFKDKTFSTEQNFGNKNKEY